ncbi:MAG: hypothetical protein OQK68_07650 [Sedimenticola sp.]|nr:hypothetical protein [Sedimenticola sp.]
MPTAAPLGMRILLSPLLLLLFLTGCGSDTTSPEEQIRKMLMAGEEAVESRSISAVQAHLSDQYSDRSGNQKRMLTRILGGYFIAHQSIHLLTQIGPIVLNGEDQAEVTIFVAVAGQPIHSASEFISLRADLLRFDLKLVYEASQWLIRSAHWRKADMSDFLE